MANITQLDRYRVAKKNIKHVEKMLLDVDKFIDLLYNSEMDLFPEIFECLSPLESLRIELMIRLDYYSCILNRNKTVKIKIKEK